jgi:hypothetical protein
MTTRAAPMENTIRPFAPVDFIPAISNLPARVPDGIVECKLGGSGGTTTTFTFEGSGFETIKSEQYKESNRASTKVRVENPDDPSQFVEFCRADKITLTSKKQQETIPRTSSYDTTGGYHGEGGRTTREYEFQYPSDRTCRSREPPKGGKC